jgi:hypothetical protein
MTDAKKKRLFIASGLGIAIAAAAIALYLPYSASAQQQVMYPTPYWNGADGPHMYSNWASNSTLAMPNITGSINVPKLISDQIKVSFSDAAKTAESQIDGGMVIGGHIGVVQGYLVYTFMLANPNNHTSYMVIVDAGNGSVLYKSEGFQMGPFGEHFGFGGGMHKFGGMMWGKHQG